MRRCKWMWKGDACRLQSFVYKQLRIMIWQEQTGPRQSPRNNKQHQQQNERNTHWDAVLYKCHWVSWRALLVAKWSNPTATTLEQGTKRTASLVDGCRNSDNASRSVEALGVPALQDRGSRGRFIGGNDRRDNGNTRIKVDRGGL